MVTAVHTRRTAEHFPEKNVLWYNKRARMVPTHSLSHHKSSRPRNAGTAGGDIYVGGRWRGRGGRKQGNRIPGRRATALTPGWSKQMDLRSSSNGRAAWFAICAVCLIYIFHILQLLLLCDGRETLRHRATTRESSHTTKRREGQECELHRDSTTSPHPALRAPQRRACNAAFCIVLQRGLITRASRSFRAAMLETTPHSLFSHLLGEA